MSATFAAKYGITIESLSDPFTLKVTHADGRSQMIDGPVAKALDERYRARNDEQIGRWRWPERPHFVVYPSAVWLHPADPDVVMVVNESNGSSHRARRDDPDSLFGHFSQAGHAYFVAHPEPKPWHDAKSGEAWVLTVDGEEFPWGVGEGADAGRFVYLGGLSNIPLEHPSITAGRRIWPEDAKAA